MAAITPSQAKQYAAQAGFTGIAQSIIVAIAQAESGMNPQARNCNNPGGSCDRGILQINSFWHPEVSDACAYDPACSFQAAYRISGNGSNFSPWTTYTSGAYKPFMVMTSGQSTMATTNSPLGSITGASAGQSTMATTNSPLGSITGASAATPSGISSTVGGISIKYIFYWGVGALALIALAGPLPDLATILVLILITGVVLTHARQYAGLFTPPPKN